MRSSSRLFICAGALLAFAAAPLRAADSAHLVLNSQPGDFIGQGQMKDITYTAANSAFFSAQVVATTLGQPSFLRFVLGTVTGSNATNTFALLDFATNALGIPFAPGTYGLPGNTAQRASFAAAGHAGLDVSFQNRGSNTLTGNFTVFDVQFFKDAMNNFQIGYLDVSFEQHSEGATPALFGRFTFTRDGFGPAAVPDGGSTLVLLLAACAVFVIVPRKLLRERSRL